MLNLEADQVHLLLFEACRGVASTHLTQEAFFNQKVPEAE